MFAEMIVSLLNRDTSYFLLIAVLFFVIVAIVMGIGFFLASRVDVVGRRMRDSVSNTDSAIPSATDFEEESKSNPLLSKFAGIAKPMDEDEMGRLRNRLINAGLRSERAVFIYLTVKIFIGLLFSGVLLWINWAFPDSIKHISLVAVLSMCVGFYLPSVWLHQRIKNRQKLVNRAMPDALDLLVTCVESGLGLDAALNRVSEEMLLNAPLLSSEMNQASLEIRAGSTRGDAFRRIATRTGVEEVRNLSSIIIQTEMFGTSIAKALRVMAEGMRVRRMQLAEERAATVAVKMTIPLILCIFPALMSVLLGPAIIKLYEFLIIRGGLN